jgi:NADPH:quinone reductase-like Zn-dependent oxidoreductase
VAGIVESVGRCVTRFRPGDRVFADLFAFGMGAFAGSVCAPERAFAPIPDEHSFEDAATLPTPLDRLDAVVEAIRSGRPGDGREGDRRR